MFERRRKIFLGILAVVIAALTLRAAQLQVADRAYWSQQASQAMRRTRTTETSRGDIRDVRNRVLATDRPCIDACVDYRAIQKHPDEAWVKARALERLHSRLGDAWTRTSRQDKPKLLQKECKTVTDDIEAMFAKLA